MVFLAYISNNSTPPPPKKNWFQGVRGAKKRLFFPIFGAKRSLKSQNFFFGIWIFRFRRLPLIYKIQMSLQEWKNEISTGTPSPSPPLFNPFLVKNCHFVGGWPHGKFHFSHSFSTGPDGSAGGKEPLFSFFLFLLFFQGTSIGLGRTNLALLSLVDTNLVQ